MVNRDNLIQRTFDLARLGEGKVSPNPVVGATISIANKLIGEGYHQAYGKAHAEVNAIRSVTKNNSNKIHKSCISVSLEPCNVYGKTPPCSLLILDHGIKKVNISAIDKTSAVNSTSISNLKEQGVDVHFPILEQKGKFVARVRNTYASKKRPYIILKYAQSQDGFLGKEDKQIWLTNSYSKRLVHKWRAEIDAIIVGTNTVKIDNPSLTTRLYPGSSPLRIAIDKTDSIPSKSNIKNKKARTWVYKGGAPQTIGSVDYKKIESEESLLPQICKDLYAAECSTLMVEGGAKLLNSFIEAGLWDEARVITSPKTLKTGVPAPRIDGLSIGKFKVHTDLVELLICPKNVIYS